MHSRSTSRIAQRSVRRSTRRRQRHAGRAYVGRRIAILDSRKTAGRQRRQRAHCVRADIARRRHHSRLLDDVVGLRRGPQKVEVGLGTVIPSARVGVRVVRVLKPAQVALNRCVIDIARPNQLAPGTRSGLLRDVISAAVVKAVVRLVAVAATPCGRAAIEQTATLRTPVGGITVAGEVERGRDQGMRFLSADSPFAA